MGKVTDNTVIRIFLTAFGDVSGTSALRTA